MSKSTTAPRGTGIRGQADLLAGRKMAAVLLNKPECDVTDAEALSARHDYVKPGDSETTFRAIRAGFKATLMEYVRHHGFPADLAGEICGSFDALDRGEVRGAAIAAKAGRWKGGSHSDEVAVFLALETSFRSTLEDVSTEEALARVTGVRRPNTKRPAPPPASLSADLRGTTYDRIRSLRKRGAELLGADGVADAKAQGLAARQGKAVDPDFASFRQGWLAIARNRAAWRQKLKKSGII